VPGGDACGTVLGKNSTWREVASFKSEIDDVIHPERVHTQIYAPR